MNRRDALRGLAALPVAGAALSGGRDLKAADESVPFTHTLDNGDRCVGVNQGCLAWDNGVNRVIGYRTGREIERVVGFNWDTPWVDHYSDDGLEVRRLFVPFRVEMEDGTTYRSASGD